MKVQTAFKLRKMGFLSFLFVFVFAAFFEFLEIKNGVNALALIPGVIGIIMLLIAYSLRCPNCKKLFFRTIYLNNIFVNRCMHCKFSDKNNAS